MARRSKAPAGLIPAPRLAGALKQGAPGVIVAAGAEGWLRRMVVEALVDDALPEGDPGGALVRLDARQPDHAERCARLDEELASGSLFAQRQVVVIEHPEAAGDVPPPPGLDKRSGPATRLALRGLERTAGDGNRLILSTGKPLSGRTGSPFKKLLDAGGWVVDCRPLYDAPGPWERGVPPHDHELSRFLVERARHVHRKVLPLEVAHLVTRRVGSALGELDGALASLAIYVGERERLEEKDVTDVLGETREDPLWKLSDLVLDGQHESALAMLEATFSRGIHDQRGASVTRPEALFAMLNATLLGAWRKRLAGAEGLAAGETGAELAKAQGIPGFRADAWVRSCRRDPERYRRLALAFRSAEAGVKGGGVPARLAAERLVLRLLHGSQSQRS